MAFPSDPPIPVEEFDHRVADKLGPMYRWAGSAEKLERFLAGHGLKVSASTLNNWRRRFNIEIADENYRARDNVPEQTWEAPPDTSAAEATAELLEWLQTRKVPALSPLMADVRKAKHSTAIIASDFHYPWHHEPSVQLLRRLVKEWRPDLLILNGDVFDFASLGRFPKNPSVLRPLQEVIDGGRVLLGDLAAASPKTKTILIPGNHEETRLINYLWTQAPALASLRCLTLENLLGLAELGITYAADGVELTDELIVLHGDRVTNQLGGGSGGSARKEQLDLGCSSVTGHTHRGGLFLRRDRRGYRVSAEGFCLCDQHAMTAAGVTSQKRGGKVLDWHRGIIRADFHPNGSAFNLTPIPFLDTPERTFAMLWGQEVQA